MAFRFRLEKVLTFRKRIVDQKSLEVGAAGRVVVGIQSRMAGVKDEMAHLLTGPRGLEVDVFHMTRRRHWLDHLANSLSGLEIQLVEAERELDNRRAELTEAWRDLEVLKRLKERQQTAWADEQFKRENQDLDEIGQIRADRQRREKLSSIQEQPAG